MSDSLFEKQVELINGVLDLPSTSQHVRQETRDVYARNVVRLMNGSGQEFNRENIEAAINDPSLAVFRQTPPAKAEPKGPQPGSLEATAAEWRARNQAGMMGIHPGVAPVPLDSNRLSAEVARQQANQAVVANSPGQQASAASLGAHVRALLDLSRGAFGLAPIKRK